MGKTTDICFKAMVACLVLSLLGVLFIVVAPALLGIDESSLDGGPLAGFVLGIVPVLVMLALILTGILSIVIWLLAVIEILKSKNEMTWKALWLLVATVLGLIGLVIYYYVGRKGLKE